MKKFLYLLCLFSIPALANVPDTVHYVDLDRYSGEWFEISRYPNKFQKDCAGSKATYKLKSNRVSVLNECQLKDDATEVKKAKGTAFVVDEQSQAKLKVSFVPLLRHFGLFAGEYWILELDSDYQYVLVGDSKREYLWILSRRPELDEEIVEQLKRKAQDLGFDPAQLVETPKWRE